jgi:hypothetical protein
MQLKTLEEQGDRTIVRASQFFCVKMFFSSHYTYMMPQCGIPKTWKNKE